MHGAAALVAAQSLRDTRSTAALHRAGLGPFIQVFIKVKQQKSSPGWMCPRARLGIPACSCASLLPAGSSGPSQSCCCSQVDFSSFSCSAALLGWGCARALFRPPESGSTCQISWEGFLPDS